MLAPSDAISTISLLGVMRYALMPAGTLQANMPCVYVHMQRGLGKGQGNTLSDMGKVLTTVAIANEDMNT